jgi:hypothetical protein
VHRDGDRDRVGALALALSVHHERCERRPARQPAEVHTISAIPGLRTPVHRLDELSVADGFHVHGAQRLAGIGAVESFEQRLRLLACRRARFQALNRCRSDNSP